MVSSLPLSAAIDQWFSRYFSAFIDIGAARMDPSDILRYWGVPLHTSSPTHSKWLMSPEEVVAALTEMQGYLKQAGYTHTQIVDKVITLYNENAGRVDTIMSRRRRDDAEVDRAAVSFELRRSNDDWTIISTTVCPTIATTLRDIW